jgi:hypothetical protein
MAHVKKGLSVRSPQWWKHLRDWKRVFWKRQRKADKGALFLSACHDRTRRRTDNEMPDNGR